MGEVGKFLFGGSTSKQGGQNSYFQQAENASQNSSAQASLSRANNFQKSGSQSYNQAYAPTAAAMTPALGYVTQAGDAMAALLGLPANSFSYKPTTYNPSASPMPAGSIPPAPSINLRDLLGQISGSLPTPSTPPPAPSPSPVIRPPVSGGGTAPNIQPGFVPRGTENIRVQFRERGGPVKAGNAYVVGEKRPEVFVPQQNGTILPSTQGLQTVSTQVNPSVNPGSALENFSNSAGMNFILDQGQKAISGASASNGVFNSGATGKALEQFGVNLGKTYLNDYMDRLMNYGQLGLGAGSALANAGGVSQSQSLGGGSSTSGSAGVSQGSSYGTSIGGGSGTTTGSSSSKKGLF